MNSGQNSEISNYPHHHHHPNWLGLLRILLGLLLIVKGIAFIDNKDEVIEMIQTSSSEFLSFMIAHYVIAAYMVGGIAVTIGFYTRTAIITVLPALIGSIIFLDLHRNLFALNSELVYSILILFLFVFYLFYGSGTFSVDFKLKKENEE
jgi:putative oxidoreductase